ncbi:MAG: TrkH family potassium uptake protein [Tractidigestivibacter sp.]|uniref:TrkH family potassium uptake protein n=1 Tax=Tractidigestivibacter sp. TaxID=2847320 RepID=UPI003D8F28EF
MRRATKLRRSKESGELESVATGLDLTIGYLGVMAMLIGVMLLVPLLFLPFWPDEVGYAWCFLAPATVMLGGGAIANMRIHGREKGHLERGQDSVILVLTWTMAMIACAVPFMLACNMSFSAAVFESISGLSTTTFTMLVPEDVPKVVLLFRSLLLFFGGIGLVLIVVSAISDSHGMRLYVTEGHTDRLLPNLKRSAKLILSIYATLIVVGTLAYMAVGVNDFDALIHAIGAVCTGGFSTHSNSIEFFQSIPVEIITCVLMILGGTGCALHMLLITGRRRDFWRDIETRSYAFTLLGGIILTTCVLLVEGTYDNLGDALRCSAFQIISAVTTTGFQSVSTYSEWPSAARLLLILGMVLGAETESTGGGIKQWRVAEVGRMLWWNVRATITHRRRVHSDMIMRLGRRRKLEQDEMTSATVFSLVYLLTLFAGTLAYTLCGHSIGQSFFEFASALGTVGLSSGIAVRGASLPVIWITIAGMFLGRLEIYPIITAFARARLVSQNRER